MTRYEEQRTLRESWDFTYRTTVVLDAARKKADHHKKRGSWWAKEVQVAEKGLKGKGFEYRRQDRSFEPDLVIVGDPQLAARAKEKGQTTVTIAILPPHNQRLRWRRTQHLFGRQDDDGRTTPHTGPNTRTDARVRSGEGGR